MNEGKVMQAHEVALRIRRDDWLACLRFHLRRGPVIVSKYSLRLAMDAIDTRNACRELSHQMMPKEVHFVPLPDGLRVVLV